MGTSILNDYEPEIPRQETGQRLCAFKRKINEDIQRICLSTLHFVVLLPFSDGSHRLQGSIIASEGYDVSNTDLVLACDDQGHPIQGATTPYTTKAHLHLNSVLYDTLTMKIAIPTALTDNRLLASMRYDSQDYATTNDIAEGHTFKDAARNALRKLLRDFGEPRLPILDAAKYLQKKDTKYPSLQHRKTVFDYVFYEMMRSNARKYMLDHLANTLTSYDNDQKLVYYKEAVDKLRNKEVFVISDVTTKSM